MNVEEIAPGPPPARVGVAVSTYNESVTDRLLTGALARLDREGVSEVSILRVPGALELPAAAEALLAAGCEAVVAIGTVIKGETDHYEIVAEQSARGLTDVSVRHGRPVTNAVLAVHHLEQALERSEPGPGNKGAEAAAAAVALASRIGALRAPAP